MDNTKIAKTMESVVNQVHDVLTELKSKNPDSSELAAASADLDYLDAFKASIREYLDKSGRQIFDSLKAETTGLSDAEIASGPIGDIIKGIRDFDGDGSSVYTELMKVLRK